MVETEMELGKSGVRVLPLGTGCWAWGDRLVWGYGRNYHQEDIRQAFQISLAQGMRVFRHRGVLRIWAIGKVSGQFHSRIRGRQADHRCHQILPLSLARDPSRGGPDAAIQPAPAAPRSC